MRPRTGTPSSSARTEAQLRCQRGWWVGHVLRMPRHRLARKFLSSSYWLHVANVSTQPPAVSILGQPAEQIFYWQTNALVEVAGANHQLQPTLPAGRQGRWAGRQGHQGGRASGRAGWQGCRCAGGRADKQVGPGTVHALCTNPSVRNPHAPTLGVFIHGCHSLAINASTQQCGTKGLRERWPGRHHRGNT